jgi:hypothetical protein
VASATDAKLPAGILPPWPLLAAAAIRLTASRVMGLDFDVAMELLLFITAHAAKENVPNSAAQMVQF